MAQVHKLRSPEMLHRCCTPEVAATATPWPAPIDIMDFWSALQKHIPETRRSLLKAEDVAAWARDRHLTKDGAVPVWVIETATANRDAWRRGPANLVTTGFNFPSTRSIAITVECPYVPGLHSRALLRRHANERFKSLLKAELDRIAPELSDELTAEDRISDHHWEWFIKSQVGGAEVKDLPPNMTGSTRPIYQALHKVAARLGLSPRLKGRFGR